MQKIVPISAYAPCRHFEATLKVKRMFDFSVALLLIVLLSPLFLILALISAIDTKSTPWFIQERSGRYNKSFNMIKFRTMKPSAPANVATHELDHPEKYISRVGHLLRKFSLDELPQLFNILKGDMSFVGPRPVVYTETYLIKLRTRNGSSAVRPGLTGLAQINGRDTVSIISKAKLDGQYVHKMSLTMDLLILWHTIGYVFASKDVVEGRNPDILAPEAKRESRSA